MMIVARDEERFVRVSVDDNDPERIEYEAWMGNDKTGNWESISWHETEEEAIREARAWALVQWGKGSLDFGRRTWEPRRDQNAD